MWLTFNETWVFVCEGYEFGGMAPGIQGKGVSLYKCGHNVIRSHARAWHTYDQNFRQSQKVKRM